MDQCNCPSEHCSSVKALLSIIIIASSSLIFFGNLNVQFLNDGSTFSAISELFDNVVNTWFPQYSI